MSTPLIDAVTGYARRLHASIGDEHHIASPLGAWLLLALAASADTDGDRAGLEAALGCPSEQADEFARTLLAQPHEAVRLAAAVWHRGTPLELEQWMSALPAQVEIGDMPTQSVADAWAADRTRGLIEQFPLEIKPDTLLILASALACAVSWFVPFDAVPASGLTLPRAPGFDALAEVMAAPTPDADCRLVSSAVGPLGVHRARSSDDLLVISVIGDAEVPAAEVIAAAHPIASALADEAAPPGRLSLFDLPLGDGPAWTITERRGNPGHRGREQFAALLPAWSAESAHVLTKPELGFGAVMTMIAPLLGASALPFEAKQVAMARYTRLGFEAAAVTAFGVPASALMAPEQQIRTARLEFTHPYAVVAVATGDGPWRGLPVFSGWITSPDEP